MTAALVLLLVAGSLAAIALAFVRILRGPSQADRIIALDVIFSASIALTAAAALATERALYLDIGIGLAIVGFVATIVWARLIDKSPREPR
jgi:multicomponent Na+:H+ antiporter subunit F